MYLPFLDEGAQGWASIASLFGDSLWKRNQTGNGTVTIQELNSQWSNPSDVSTILMIIGGDVVQSALAQSTGSRFTPVCFSFGWVSYAFNTLLHVVGDGRLLPPPDYPVKIYNLKSGYVRDNRNWVVGRLLRDAEAWIEKKKPLADDAIRISVFEAQKKHNGDHPTRFMFDRTHLWGSAVILVQLIIASIPIILNREWGVLFITAAGTVLVQITGSLPQWRAEKLPNRQHSNEIYALTTGNGAKDVMVIIGRRHCLDLEEFSVSVTPRNGKPWEKFQIFSKPRTDESGKPMFYRTGSEIRKSKQIMGLPYGFWVTRIVSIVLSILWLLLLINVAAIKDSTWYLLLVGAIGMFQNGILAAMARSPKSRNIPLRHADTITANKVMDGIMDFEYTYKCGQPLLREFFPGDLRPSEKEWWDGNPTNYDKARQENHLLRGVPRRFLPPIQVIFDPDHTETTKNPTLKLSEISKTENGLSNSFSDPNTSGNSPPIPQQISRSSVRYESIVSRVDTGRMPSPTLSSSRSLIVPLASRYPVNREFPTVSPQSNPSEIQEPVIRRPLSAREVINRARSPDWAY